mgnify:FL=1
MGISWTEEQQKVIELRGRNILVSAAAGSGKTAVLVERIITMLTAKEHPTSVDQLLIVTFTEAAAAEMKDRIRTAIEKKLEEEPENEHLMRQATLIHNAQITTIHSFCLSVIRDHFHVIDLDPSFRVGEEGELKLLRRDVLEELLEDKYQEGKEPFLAFASAYGNGRDDRKIEELILKIYEFSRSYPDAKGWLASCVAAYQADTREELEKSPYVALVMKHTRKCLQDARELLRMGLSICKEADGPMAYEPMLTSDLYMIEDFLAADSYGKLNEKMREISWMKLASNRGKTISERKTAKVKAIREEVKGLLGDLASQYFYQDVEEMLSDIRLCRPQMQVLAELVEEFAGRFEESKREKNLIDFSDMEQYALRILTRQEDGKLVPSRTAEEYRRQYEEIMIDEYQDSNLIQETILTSISAVSEGRYNIFMVGDVKQSIYRFRLSRPELFMEKYDTYSLSDSVMQRIDLHKNFRSRAEVLEGVNYIFRQIMTRGLGGIGYDDNAALYPGAAYPEYPIRKERASIEGQEEEQTEEQEDTGTKTEVLVIDSGSAREEVDISGQDGKPGGGRLSDRELEARAIAGQIRELMRTYQVVDKESGRFRSVRYSDIVILTRSVKGFADTFAEVLNREGIPACAGTREGYFETQEIGVLLDYLRVIGNNQQDLPLAAVLSSPFGGLSQEELAEIKSEYRELPFYRAVSCYEKEGRDEKLQRKLRKCLGQIESFREKVPYTPIQELLRKILTDTGYLDFVSAMPGGEQRRANLEMLLEKAKTFESASYKGLFHFIRYIGQLKKYNVDYGEASLTDEQSDTVRIMTIHKSKGLEFPVVFVAGMGKRMNMQDVRSSVVFHAGLGVGLDAVDLEKRTQSPSIIKKVIQKNEQLDSLGEELRVLYVAFTRAKEKLILTGTMANVEKKLESFEMVRNRRKEELSFERLSKAVTYWDWILPALVRMTPDVPIRVHTLTLEDIVAESVEEETAERITKGILENWDAGQIYEPAVKEELKKQFGYQYPYAGSRMQKLKFTVSELKKRKAVSELAEYASEQAMEAGEALYEEPEVIPLLPRFLQETQKLSGAGRGTAYHRLMELLDFREEYTEETLVHAVETFTGAGKMTEEMADCIQMKDILAFLESTAGKRMRACAANGCLWKEQPFVLGVEARELYSGEPEGELILVQGIIDVYFEEEGGLVVLDYKTDKVRTAGELTEKYHAQLDYYAKALEQITHKKVKEKIIYSFHLREEILL